MLRPDGTELKPDHPGADDEQLLRDRTELEGACRPSYLCTGGLMFSQSIPRQMDGDAIGNCAWNPGGKLIIIEVAARLCLKGSLA